MIIGLLAIAAAVADASSPVVQPPANRLEEASRALEAGRLDQARLMIGQAVASGQSGVQIDTLTADLAFAAGKDAEALAGYEHLMASGVSSGIMFERAGIAAIRRGDLPKALQFINKAVEDPRASWRAWNARGVIADQQRDWAAADDAYAHAISLSPQRGEIANNMGWSQLLRGNWNDAAAYFERAAATMGGASSRVANNLELARAALANELPKRRRDESDSEWAARLNDAGVAASIMGDQKRAVAAFAQALEASGSWYARAANNLQGMTAAR